VKKEEIVEFKKAKEIDEFREKLEREKITEIDNDMGFSFPVHFEFVAHLRKIKLENGGEWSIEVPELGTMAFCDHGQSPFIAIKKMEEFGKWLILDTLKRRWDQIEELKAKIEDERED